MILLSALKYHVIQVKWTNFYRPLWLLSSVINSLYSFYWDVTRDWDLRYVNYFSRNGNPLNQQLYSFATNNFCLFFFPSAVFSLESSNSKIHICAQIFFMPGNGYVCWSSTTSATLVIMFWLYGNWLSLQVFYWAVTSNLILRCTWTYKLSSHLRHNYVTVFIISALEIFRRFQWIFFRVENEWNKMTAFKSSSDISIEENSEENDKLLGASNHNVWTHKFSFLAAIPFLFIGSLLFSQFCLSASWY